MLPTKRQVITELLEQIEACRISHRLPDGKITDAGVLHTIRCLEVALSIVKGHKFPK